MTESVWPRNVEQFRTLLARDLGLQFDDSKLGFLSEILQRRHRHLGLSPELYLHGLDAGPAQPELTALARELTVGETYFFRNSEQFQALQQVVLPERIQANAATRILRFLSAGCASGEEAYTIAIILAEVLADPSWTASIRAVDVNADAIEKAVSARYSSWAMRETSASVRSRWFRTSSQNFILADAARAAVHFEQRNLARDDDELWQPRCYDVIFCRNVIMYFAPDQARALIARITWALAPGGYLFLGHAETLRGLSDNFHLRHTHGTFYYQRKDAVDFTASRAAPASSSAIAFNDPTLTLGESWIDAIRGASERIAKLTTTPNPSDRLPAAAPPLDLTRIFDLLRTERFIEALAAVRALPVESARDPDVLLLEAMLLALGGVLTEAENTCRQLLVLDELNAGAHYVFALCRESAGDYGGAAEHNRMASYLDPAFAMPRLHLGLLARRAGDRAAARRELAQALVLLEREDTSRLLLFGGGFNREALRALCESALRDCGGAP